MLNHIDVPEPLKQVLRDYCHVEWAEQIMDLRIEIKKTDCWFDADLFKNQLRDAIENKTISPKDYEKITSDDRESREEVVTCLKEIWDDLFIIR